MRRPIYRAVRAIVSPLPGNGSLQSERLRWLRRTVYIRTFPLICVALWLLGPVADPSSTVGWVLASAFSACEFVGFSWGTFLIQRNQRREARDGPASRPEPPQAPGSDTAP